MSRYRVVWVREVTYSAVLEAGSRTEARDRAKDMEHHEVVSLAECTDDEIEVLSTSAMDEVAETRGSRS